MSNPAASPSAFGLLDSLGDHVVINGTSYPIDMAVGAFTLALNSEITSIQFTGGYNGDDPTGTDSFVVNFYGDNSGQPGTLLSSQTLSTVTRTSLAPSGGGIQLSPGHYAYAYQGVLDVAQNLSSGSYFFGLSEVAQPTPGSWYWDGSTGGTTFLLDSSSSTYNVIPLQPSGVAFELDGQTVPEPSAIVMLIAALGVLSCRRRVG